MHIDDTTTNTITEVSDSLLTGYISTEVTKQYLFPADRVIIDYLPCKLLNSNLRFMKGPEDFTDIYTNVKVENSCVSGLLSCGTIYPCNGYDFHYTLEIFGTDTSSLKRHIVSHLEIIKKKAVGLSTIHLGLYIDKCFSQEIVEDIFSSYGVKRTEAIRKLQNSEFEEMVLYEKKL